MRTSLLLVGPPGTQQRQFGIVSFFDPLACRGGYPVLQPLRAWRIQRLDKPQNAFQIKRFQPVGGHEADAARDRRLARLEVLPELRGEL